MAYIDLDPIVKTYKDSLKIEIKRGYVYFSAEIDGCGNVFKISRSKLRDLIK